MSSLYTYSTPDPLRGCNPCRQCEGATRWASLFFCLILLDEVLPRSHLGLHRVMVGIWGNASFYSQSLYVGMPFGINTVLQVKMNFIMP